MSEQEEVDASEPQKEVRDKEPQTSARRLLLLLSGSGSPDPRTAEDLFQDVYLRLWEFAQRDTTPTLLVSEQRPPEAGEDAEARGEIRVMLEELDETIRRMRRTQTDIDRLKEETWAVLARINVAA